MAQSVRIDAHLILVFSVVLTHHVLMLLLVVTHEVLLPVSAMALSLFFCFAAILPIELLLPLSEVLKLDSMLFSFFHLALVLLFIDVSLHHLFFIFLVRSQEIALAQLLILIVMFFLILLLIRALMMAVLHLQVVLIGCELLLHEHLLGELLLTACVARGLLFVCPTMVEALLLLVLLLLLTMHSD